MRCSAPRADAWRGGSRSGRRSSRRRCRLLTAFRLDTGPAHHVCPLRLIAADEASELIRGVAGGGGGGGGEAGRGGGAFGAGSELGADFPGGGDGGEEPEPAEGFVAGDAGLVDGGEVGEGFGAPVARGGEGFELAGRYVLDHRLRRGEEEVDLSGEEVGDGLAGALVGNMQQVDPGHGLEELCGEVRGGAGAGGAEGELAGIRAGKGDEVAD